MKKRLESLDILRGITVTFMCMVNNPGSWGHMYAPMKHAAWFGCTPTDLIYPFFIFCAGVAMAFSFSKYDGNAKAGVKKVITRSIGIFLVGFLLNMYPFFPTDNGHFIFGWEEWKEWFAGKRIFGVLQRIACAYLIAGLLVIWLKTPKKIGIAIGTLFVAYTAILVIFGTEPGPFTLEGTVSRKVDVALLGEGHVYHGYAYDFDWAKAQQIADGTYTDDAHVVRRAAFDPEGPLGALPAACSCLFGFLVGYLIKKTNKRREEEPLAEKNSITYMVCRIFAYGMVCLGAGLLVGIWIPISKPLWSISYVMYAAGWAMIALAFLTFCIDVVGIKKVFSPFKVMGTNALMAFVLSALIAKSYQFIGGMPLREFYAQNNFTSFLHSCVFAIVIFCCLFPLYKKKIFIRL